MCRSGKSPWARYVAIEWFDPLGQKDVRPEVVDVLRGVATLDASFSQGRDVKS